MAVVSIHAPRLQDAVRVAVLAGTADVVHDFVPPVLDDRLPYASRDVVQRLVPRHLAPLSRSPLAAAFERVEDPVGILELVGRDDALRARTAAAARVQRIALDLADLQLLLVHVGEDAARRLAVEAGTRDDPVVLPIFLRPARGLEIHVVIPGRRVWVRHELRHCSIAGLQNCRKGRKDWLKRSNSAMS